MAFGASPQPAARHARNAKIRRALMGRQHNAAAHAGPTVATAAGVLVHGAARPCIRRELVEQFLDGSGDGPGGGPLAMPLADTLKRADENQRVAETIARAGLWRAQTPQMFRYELLRRGLEKKPDATDESAAA